MVDDSSINRPGEWGGGSRSGWLAGLGDGFDNGELLGSEGILRLILENEITNPFCRLN